LAAPVAFFPLLLLCKQCPWDCRDSVLLSILEEEAMYLEEEMQVLELLVLLHQVPFHTDGTHTND
jgi:hypothetical protein